MRSCAPTVNKRNRYHGRHLLLNGTSRQNQCCCWGGNSCLTRLPRTRQRNHLASPPTLVNVALVSSTLASRSIQSWIYPVSIRTNFGDLKQTQLLF